MKMFLIILPLLSLGLTTPKNGNAPNSPAMAPDLNPSHTKLSVVVAPPQNFIRALSWDAVSNAATYTLYYGTNSDLTGPWSTNVVGTNVTVSLTTNQFYTDYFFAAVVAVDILGVESEKSIPVRLPDFDPNETVISFDMVSATTLESSQDLKHWSIYASQVSSPFTNAINFDLRQLWFRATDPMPIYIKPSRGWNAAANHFGR